MRLAAHADERNDRAATTVVRPTIYHPLQRQDVGRYISLPRDGAEPWKGLVQAAAPVTALQASEWCISHEREAFVLAQLYNTALVRFGDFFPRRAWAGFVGFRMIPSKLFISHMGIAISFIDEN